MHIAGRDHIYATEVNGNTTTLFGNGWYGLENGIKYTNIQIQRYTNTNTEWQFVLGQLCSIKYTNIPIQKCTNTNTQYIGGGLVAGLVGQLASAFGRTLFRENFAN